MLTTITHMLVANAIKRGRRSYFQTVATTSKNPRSQDLPVLLQQLRYRRRGLSVSEARQLFTACANHVPENDADFIPWVAQFDITPTSLTTYTWR